MGSLLAFKRPIFGLAMLLFGVLMITPFIFMLSFSLKPTSEVFIHPLQLIPQKLYLVNFERLFAHEYYFNWYRNSIVVVFLTILLRSFFVTMAAYAFARLHFKGKNIMFLLLISTMMIPPDTTIVARFLLYKYMHLVNTHWVIILPAIFDVFFIFLLRQFFTGIPKELSESALIDGCSHFKIYYRIILPLAVPALVTMALFTFIWSWNDFVNPFIFISSIQKQLVTVGLEYFQKEAGRDYAMQMAGACFIVIAPIAMFALSQRFFIQGIVMTGIKG